MFRAVLVLVALAGPAQAGTMLVIDDFTDPVQMILPGDPESIVTPNVGDLNAQRTIEQFDLLPEQSPVFRAEVRDGRYSIERTVSQDDPVGVVYGIAWYDFPTTDFSQFEAIILDIGRWPDPSTDPSIPSIPGMDLFVEGQAVLRRELRRGVRPGRLVLPLETFTHRGGAGPPVDQSLWSSVNRIWVQVGADPDWGPWAITFDRFALGPAVPEPSSVASFATGVLGWLLLYYLLRRGNHACSGEVFFWQWCCRFPRRPRGSTSAAVSGSSKRNLA